VGGSGRVRGTTRLVGVIGWPVEHSLSPAIHNAAFASLGLDWAYVALPVAPNDVVGALLGLRALGFAGANVTMPHKSEIARLVDERSEDAARLGAVNTVVVGERTISGHNTDAPGFARFLREDVGFDTAGKTALLYGAGGAARACALALARASLGRLMVAARDPERTSELRDAIRDLPTELVIARFEDAGQHTADLVVNATPLGAGGEELPLPSLGRETLVVDLLYDPAVTPLLSAAREAGAAAFGGLGLLLQQAALSFELWTAQVAPLDVMSAAALAALAERS
jgi:shikimate dehydrogenase